jgi:hypothetical protein
MTSRFDATIRKIRRSYCGLGHKLGWRFLYSPAKTFSSKTRIWLIGTNPGGCHFERSKPSVEKGNAYRVEPWDGGRLNPLQKQVCAFYSIVSKAIPGSDFATLMDETLSANFVPFRSASWAKLRQKRTSIQFARSIWAEILAFIRPDVIVTMGSEIMRQIDSLLEASGSSVRARSISCDWGAVKYRLGSTTIFGKKVLLIGLPHLSRFRIFNRSKGNSCFTLLVKAVRRHLR